MEFKIESIGFSYVRGKNIFEDLSLNLRDGEILSILGINGAGKSTLMNCLAGLYHPSSGEIRLDGKSLLSMSRNEISRNIGYVPQVHDSSFSYSVLEYVVMGRTPYIAAWSVPSKADYEIARENLARVGMAGMESRIFTEISGGEQQLAMIARVLTQEAKIILLDEPTNHLDYGNQYRALNIMKSLAAEGYIVITTTHNPDHALLLGGTAAVLVPGHSLITGPAETVLTSERLSTLYGMDIGVSFQADAGRQLCYVKGNANGGSR